MRLAYVMPVHKNPAQVLRLLDRLEDGDSAFVVHVDANADDAVERELRRGTRGRGSVAFLPRRPCYWGGFGIVDVALRAFDLLLSRGDPFDHALYVTGQDYPLVSSRLLRAHLDAAGGRSFIGAAPLPVPFWPGGGRDRIGRWHLVSRVALHLPVPWRRQVPGGLVPYGGGANWALARAAVEHVDAAVRREPGLVRFFRHVLHPDELFFQTLLLSSKLAGSVVDRHLHYVSWAADPGPKILGVEDLDAMLSSGALFARKFDTTVDSVVLDRLDERIAEERDVVAR